MWSTPWARATSTVAVGRAVVDHEPLDRVEARDARAGGPQSVTGSDCLLVEAGNLDDEFHGRGIA